MKKKLFLAGIAIVLAGCQSKGAGWPISLSPSTPPNPAPRSTQNQPSDNSSDQISKTGCTLNFNRSLNLKQIAMQAALLYQKCKLSEDQIMALLDVNSIHNNGQNSGQKIDKNAKSN